MPETASVPMSIRLRWERGAWWAYFNDWPEPRFFAQSLDDVCTLIRHAFPPGTTVLPA